MTHPPKAVETLALFICRNNHGHVDLDSLGIIARRMILLRATKICDIIAPFYVDRLRELAAPEIAELTDRITALEAQVAAAFAEVADMQTALDANWVSHQSLVSAGLQLAAADLLVQSAVRLVDVAVRISEVDNDNRMMDDVADTQSALAAYRAIRGGV